MSSIQNHSSGSQAAALQAPPVIGAYVHLPWCVRKCPYCDFNSHALRAPLDEAGYLAALRADISAERAAFGARRIGSVFFGGGTPSLMSAATIGAVLEALAQHFGDLDGAEITLEMNPGASDAGRVREYRAAGVNRISIGAQSFDDGALQRLGRIHGADEIGAAVAAVRAAGFERFNLDLMFGLPGQDRAAAAADLEAALTLAPPHLSYYQLTLEPGTLFERRPPPELPPPETQYAMQQAGAERLAAAGFERYEVSAYALAGQACRHNLNYWRFGDYLGVGAGAHGKQTAAAGVRRRHKFRGPDHYRRRALAGDATAGETRPQGADLALEYLLNVLRLPGGFTLAAFRRATGLDQTVIAAPLATALGHGWLLQEGDHIRPSAAGYDLLNEVLELFLPEPAAPA